MPNSFGIDNHTLLQALSYGGGSGLSGGARILLRAAVAALLNASHPDIDYPWTPSQVISAVNAALASGNRATMVALAADLDADNNLGCPINGQANSVSDLSETTAEAEHGFAYYLPALRQ